VDRNEWLQSYASHLNSRSRKRRFILGKKKVNPQLNVTLCTVNRCRSPIRGVLSNGERTRRLRVNCKLDEARWINP
jgi:hypothetical protein